MYVIKGETTYFINNQKFELNEGDMIFNPEGNFRQAHTDRENPMHCFAFNFKYKFINTKSESNNNSINLPLKNKFHVGIDYKLLKLYHKFKQTWLEKEAGYLLKARGLFTLILHRLIKYYSTDNNNQKQDPRIEKAKKFILSHYQENLNNKKLAKIVHLHPVYFGSLFKKKTGHTVSKYINIIRINKAYDLLSTGENVTETAYQCGFNDPFYFCKVFKKIKGFPPSELKI